MGRLKQKIKMILQEVSKREGDAVSKTFINPAGHKHEALASAIPELHDCRCGARPGQHHSPKGCDYEICFECGCISCECNRRSRRKTKWRGEYPGAAECREFGFYC